MQTKVFDMAGKQVGEITLSDAVFGIEPNEAVVHDVVKNHLANCRQGTQSALTRAEVSGGGIKPWRQKGTGRARQGSIRAPQWTHGGIVFAPKPRDYSYTLNKKVKRLAMKSVLSDKAASENIVVIDEIKMDSIKTKTFKTFLNAVGVTGKALVVTAENAFWLHSLTSSTSTTSWTLRSSSLIRLLWQRSRRCSHNEDRIRHHYQARHHRTVHGRG